VADSSGNGHTGAYTSAATLNQAGATSDGDGAISGTGTMVTYKSGTGLPTGSSARSVEFWYKTGTSQSNTAFVAWGTQSSSKLFAVMLSNATTLKVTNWNSNYLFILPSGKSAFDGQWHQVVATWTGSSLTVYFDGASLGSKSATFNTALNTAGMDVGSSTGGSYKYTGVIDELAIYSQALTAAQVQAHYAAR
jgi:hypothetical protein